MATPRRRDLQASPMHDRNEQNMPTAPVLNITSAFSYITGRRRRLFTYLAVFTAMLAVSYLIDLRKDPIYDWIQKERGVRFDSKPFPITHPNSVQPVNTVSEDQFVSEPEKPNIDVEMSEQELKDVVDQFIDHVDQESIVNDTKQENINDKDYNSKRRTITGEGNQVSSTISSTITAFSSTSNVTIEDQFTDSQHLLEKALVNKTLRAHLDDQDLRTFRALALQATRGDCEQSDEEGSGGGVLFKTDAEAASAEIEKTDALYGAWCVFKGRYQSDAMREYITATESLREHAANEAMKSIAQREDNNSEPLFDENAFSIENIISPEKLANLRTQSELVKPHLSDGESRLISALGLQAAFGDCIPYSKLPKEEREPRELLDPLLNATVKRKTGALWGAWCVFSRTSRSNAAEMLTERVEEFWKQLDEHNQSENAEIKSGTSGVAR